MKFELNKEVYDYCMEQVRLGPDLAFTCEYGKFKAKQLATARMSIARRDKRVSAILFGANVWTQLVSERSLYQMIEPYSRDRVLIGNVGAMIGCDLWTDVYLPADQRFVPENDLLILSENLDNELRACVLVRLHEKQKRGLRKLDLT